MPHRNQAGSVAQTIGGLLRLGYNSPLQFTPYAPIGRTPRTFMHIHILGICGTFMGGVAALARGAGHRVTGCDANVYPPMSDQLQALGIELIQGYRTDQVALAPDLWVIGNVISRGNPLIEEILDRGLAFVSGPQWIAQHILRDKWVLAVAGTHGKTTTSSMLAWILQDCGYEPGFLIGGIPKNFGVSARRTESNFFVIEGDEYDTAFFDKRSKFVHYLPRTLVLNNLEFDHADIFPDLAAIETQFHHLIRTVSGNGCVVCPNDDPALARVLARGIWTPVQHLGHGAWDVSVAIPPVAHILHGQSDLGEFKLPMAGRHNARNALAALVAARHVGVQPADAMDALQRFAGVRRRMEKLGEFAGISVYDDFAHHPSAIDATIGGLREALAHQPGQRILAVLEPRSNTMKLGVMKTALASSLAGADLIFGYGAAQGKDALGWDLHQVMRPLGERAMAFDDVDQLVHHVAAEARAGDHILIMSNGGFANVHGKIIAALTKKEAH
jgi:UDP-N-acetylmuramate: L-alanyl-gamma-D-glutamyl-meso-diaminopimelate ligase